MEIAAELERSLGAGSVLEDEAAARFAVCGVTPAAAVEPASREAAAAVVRCATERGWAIVPWGGGTEIDFGFPPRRYDIALSTRRLSRVVDYQPEDMTVTVEPGLPLAELQALLAGRGQFLPLDPPLAMRATVGGIVAAAASGPWRAAWGTPRDWVIGCRVLGPDGREIRGGGQVVKNVAGYDLPKLYTGSFGTLGLLVEVTFKVLPRPPAAGYARVPLAGPEQAEALLARILDSDLQPTAAELLAAPAEGWSLFVQFLHNAEGVAWQLRHLSELAAAAGTETVALDPEAGERELQALRDLPAGAPFLARIGGVSGQAARLAAAALGAAEEHRSRSEPPARVRAHAATGQVELLADASAPESLAQAVRVLAAEAGASCVFPRLPPALAGRVDPWGEPGPALRLLRGIKSAFDPSGTFSPGRFVAGL